MGSRGRKSAAEFQTKPPSARPERPGPLQELSQKEAVVWKNTVAAMPESWFQPETHELLAAYCRHTVSARHISAEIQRCQEEDSLTVEDYDKLLKMRERETRAASSLATRLRITKQAENRTTGAKKTGRPSAYDTDW